MTKKELQARLQTERFRDDTYTLDGTTPPYEGCMLVEAHGIWYVQYFERGETREIARFTSENEACERFYEMLDADSTMRS